MPKQVNIHYAKTHLSSLLEEVEKGEEIVIARAGKPVARVIAVAPLTPRFGLDRGKLSIPDDFDEPDEEIIRLFEGEEGEFD